MSDMQISVRFRRESGVYRIINALCKIFINFLFNKISGNNFFFFCLFCHLVIFHNFLLVSNPLPLFFVISPYDSINTA